MRRVLLLSIVVKFLFLLLADSFLVTVNRRLRAGLLSWYKEVGGEVAALQEGDLQQKIPSFKTLIVQVSAVDSIKHDLYVAV